MADNWQPGCDCKVSGYFGAASVVVNEIVYCWTHEKAFEYKAALTTIAQFNDASANHSLVQTGSYGSFDEPGSVETARAALAGGK